LVSNETLDKRGDVSVAYARIRASTVHLAVSLTLAGLLILLVTHVWYPTPLFHLAGGQNIFLILVGCDITLGPAMTLVVFNIRKPRRELVRDIGIVAAIQLIAMIYGVSTLLTARPAFIVYNAGQFNVTLANEIIQDEPLAAPPKSETSPSAEAPASPRLAPIATMAPKVSAPWLGPKVVGVRFPSDIKEHNDLLFSAVSGRGDIFQMPRYFVPYVDVRAEVVAHARTSEAIAKELQIETTTLNDIDRRWRKVRSNINVRYLPFLIRKMTALALIDGGTGDLLGIEEISSRP